MVKNTKSENSFRCKICKGDFKNGQNIVIHVYEHNYDDDISSWLYHESCKIKRIKQRLER